MPLDEQSLPYIRSISPYQPGKPITQLARDLGLPVDRIVKLASNENPLGMSPKAQAAVGVAIAGLSRYPDDFALKQALAERSGLGMERIVLGNGSNDVLDLVARVFLAPGRSAIFAQYAFAVYPLATISTGGEPIAVAASDYGHDLEAMLAAIRPNTRLIWIANPNNPTGTFLPYAQLKTFLQAVPSNIVVVLDEAYNEYLPPAERVDTTAWLARHGNLVITRTFSKIYGLAGLRIGYALCSAEIADLMNRVRQPFNCNNLALAAAVAALDDHEFVARSYALNRAGMEQIIAGLKRLACRHIPSHGNFLTFYVPEAAAVNQKLLSNGVIVRPIAAYGMPDWLRVTIGTESENSRFLEALEVSL
ncbi:MAG: Histidinol-phosphate aminotransferase 2 [Candidatus Accumulibacter regalis]|jgi:histidinol-phosphate aminotransferase|uniref:Histidinol-phosphate aminotransferase n=1 Tax=Accumulibacter regalis TaxID=522306 RepID=A0A011QJP1_ACCRE|nr:MULTISPECIES: histidinol-phosphate transaminase [unclassified Candidatus Accumulibacter]EXI89260.1 MAG: Histidinol-phosphate aminotransferase 2 [Candidatus Accumulibacter regalis]MBN8513692.1 histidinol-phosphate transaminase [Accumulibacter sp.]MBO3701166.1 histidinol-phosphate transaminase [Accumulibacter sp.]HRE69272.1 histidinol-phosphate transaminase [Accumulibacter sp.]HRE85256.1 histidinol-phosphate transaminase [Accumulibacter sp.]